MGARRLGQDEQYLTVREILSEASTFADGALSRERNDFYRFGYATLGSILEENFSFLTKLFIFSRSNGIMDRAEDILKNRDI